MTTGFWMGFIMPMFPLVQFDAIELESKKECCNAIPIHARQVGLFQVIIILLMLTQEKLLQARNLRENFMKIFETWTYKKTKFIAFPHGAGIMVFDEHGNNYGAWQKLSNFRKRQSKGERLDLLHHAILIPLILHPEDFRKISGHDELYE